MLFRSIGETLTVECEMGSSFEDFNRQKENQPVYAFIITPTWNAAES